MNLYPRHDLFCSIDGSVHDLHFEDFTLESCRQFGFDIKDGRHLTFRNMEFKNTGIPPKKLVFFTELAADAT